MFVHCLLLCAVCFPAAPAPQTAQTLFFPPGASFSQILGGLYEDPEWRQKEDAFSRAQSGAARSECLSREWAVLDAFFSASAPPEWLTLATPPKNVLRALLAIGQYENGLPGFQKLTACYEAAAAGLACTTPPPGFPASEPILLVCARAADQYLSRLAAAQSETPSLKPSQVEALHAYTTFQRNLQASQGTELARLTAKTPQYADTLNDASQNPEPGYQRFLPLKTAGINLDARSQAASPFGKSYAETLLRLSQQLCASF